MIAQYKRKPWRIKTCVIPKQGRLQVKARDHRSLGQAQVGRNVFEHGQHFDGTPPQILGIILFGDNGWFADGCSFGLGVFGVRLGVLGPGFGVFGAWFGGYGVFEGLISQDFAQKGPSIVQGVHGHVEIRALSSGILNGIAQVAGSQGRCHPFVIGLVLEGQVHKIHEREFVDRYLVIGVEGMIKAGGSTAIAQVLEDRVSFGLGIEKPKGFVNTCSRIGIVFQP